MSVSSSNTPVMPARRRMRTRTIAGSAIGMTLTLLVTGAAPAAAYPRPGATERVSVATDGTEGKVDSFSPTISADGRQVAFYSSSANLVPGDENNRQDIFVHDRETGTTERVSVASDGTEGDGHSGQPGISSDGRYIVFRSPASNLVPGDTNNSSDIFVHDRETGTTERVSVASDGTEQMGVSFYATISGDGRYVAFHSSAPNLVPDDTNGNSPFGGGSDIFVHDRDTGITERVSVASDGTESNDSSSVPAISADGRFVAFQSWASNLVPGDANATVDVFVHDRVTGSTERVSVSSEGTEANLASFSAAISADGRHVAFDGAASNLVPGDTNDAGDVFVHDRATGSTERVSVASDGAQVDLGFSQTPAISADGRHVAFHSGGSTLIPSDNNGTSDVFVHDRVTRSTERVSVASDGTEALGFSNSAAISADGRHVAFSSLASNLVPDDTNRVDVFVHDFGDPLGVFGDLSVAVAPSSLEVSGRATISGAVLSAADDPGSDGVPIAGAVGAELTGARIVHRPEQEDLLLRLAVSSLPSGNVPVLIPSNPVGAGVPGVLYGMELTADGVRFEVRVLRTAAVTGSPPRTPYAALYRCEPVCLEERLLSGAVGTTGNEVLTSVPLEALGGEGTALSGLRAFTAVGEAAPGAVIPVDEAELPDAVASAPGVELGIAPSGTSESEVVFDTPADLTEGSFSGSLDVSALPPGNYDVWARACLGEACGATSTPVSLGEPDVEVKDTTLELVVEGRGQAMALTARLAELGAPQNPVAGRTIDFYSDSELIGSEVTDSDGVATIPIPPGHRGANRTYEAIFSGDDLYAPSSAERSGRNPF